MLKIDLSKKADRFLRKLPRKHSKQIAQCLHTLRLNPEKVPSKALKGYAPFHRAKSGEYRIIFYIKDETLYVPLIGKRNDKSVYQILKDSIG